ncbi:hypothetical protein V0U79_13050 [Hyphobacterium sp. HN65]|uniref:DUF945 domain-containing protein n=1 Tax=Hyphobacterium lacteum TaxID=3116575 RepID=A0ABU7LTR3_9PROT|nr:hypothetical protein [Hyphobacterium sp. HN65]MEE2527287.1 hypothetical protein [Hyphobacterium sp. HN65]
MKNALIVTVSALALAACGSEQGSEPDGDNVTTQVDEATATSALAALYLAESGQGAVSWESRSFNDGVFTFTGVTFDMEDGAPEDSDDEAGEDGDAGGEMEIEVEAGEVHAETMTLSAPRFDADGNVIFDLLSIDNIDIRDENGEGEGTITRFVIEQPNAAMAEAFARGFSNETGDEDDINGEDWTYGLFAIEGLNFTGADESDDFTAAFDRFAIEDLGEYTIGRFELTNLSIAGSSADVGIINISLAELSADNIGEAITYPFAAQFAMASSSFSADTPNEDIAADMPEMPEGFDPLNTYEHAEIRGLNANVGGVVVTLDSFTADVSHNGNEVVSTGEMTPLVIAPDTNYPFGAQLALGLGLMGYQQLEFVSAGASVYERDTDRSYTTGENYFEMRDGFRVDVETDIAGIMAYTLGALRAGPMLDESDPAVMMDMLRPLVLNNFVFRLEDQSLLDRALTAASAAQGVPKESLRMQAGGLIALATLGAPAEIPRELLAEFSTAMSAFIAEGGSVELRIAPPEPLSVATLIEQAGEGNIDYDAAGISITAIPPEDSGD